MSLRFDPQNPYPRIDLAAVPYEEQKEHARQVDAWLGFEIETIESRIERENPPREKIREQWIGLPPQSLQTPYVELRKMVDAVAAIGELKPGTTFMDIGAAYGRLAFVLNAHLPDARFIGVEISEPRVKEGQRVMALHGLEHAELLAADALTQDLSVVQVFFTYDFGPLKSIQTLLEKLKARAKSEPIIVVGRGRATRDEIERKHPWLSQVTPAQHYGNFSIYRS